MPGALTHSAWTIRSDRIRSPSAGNAPVHVVVQYSRPSLCSPHSPQLLSLYLTYILYIVSYSIGRSVYGFFQWWRNIRTEPSEGVGDEDLPALKLRHWRLKTRLLLLTEEDIKTCWEYKSNMKFIRYKMYLTALILMSDRFIFVALLRRILKMFFFK